MTRETGVASKAAVVADAKRNKADELKLFWTRMTFLFASMHCSTVTFFSNFMPETQDQKLDSKCCCVICGNSAVHVFAVRGYPIAECTACGHRFLSAPLQNDHVERVYADNYFFGGGAGYTNYLSQEELLVNRGRNYAKRMERYLGRKGKVLDVGAAAGFLVQGWLISEWEATGIEPNLRMVEHGKTRGIDLRHGAFEESADLEQESFDCVSMVQVISHLPSPVDSMKLAFKLLKPGGLMLIETWDRKSWIATWMKSGWHEYSPPSVLHWFHLLSLTKAANVAGFEFMESRRALRWLNVGHAKSLLQYMSSTSLIASIASRAAVIAPSSLNILYPGDDLFWAVYRKPSY